MSEPTLPPRPDPQTGEPFPPHAPGFTGDRLQLQRAERHGPEPPAGMGPPLAWWRELYEKKIGVLLFSLIFFAFAVSIISYLNGGTFGDGLLYWQMWLIILVVSLLIVSPMTIRSQAAGADWFQLSKKRLYRLGPPKPAYICTYDLVKVEADGSVLKWSLDLVDRFGHSFLTSSDELQRHRQIWDLVYNGILHSVANGAKINMNALVLLQLEATPALAVRVEKEKNGEPMPNRSEKYKDSSRDDHWNPDPDKPDSHDRWTL